jgi:succinate dehydrogenase/fumarate reductase cytochrome b subunit
MLEWAGRRTTSSAVCRNAVMFRQNTSADPASIRRVRGIIGGLGAFVAAGILGASVHSSIYGVRILVSSIHHVDVAARICLGPESPHESSTVLRRRQHW